MITNLMTIDELIQKEEDLNQEYTKIHTMQRDSHEYFKFIETRDRINDELEQISIELNLRGVK